MSSPKQTGPYERLNPSKWRSKTDLLIAEHPLDPAEIAEVVLSSWQSIFDSQLGTKKFKIGQHIFPKPQIMGFFLHELIPLEFAARHPGKWRVDTNAEDKDLVYIPNNRFSIEIKTSSHASQIFGNRSYAQPAAGSKKGKDGYYLAVNFGKFSTGAKPEISRIQFGWLDHTDWIPQKSPTGQQARLAPSTYGSKLIQLWPKSGKD